MTILFYVAGLIAVIATLLAISRTNAVHALLYLVVSLLAVSLVFFSLGAPFVAALEVIVYAGAIMVLFVFVMMLLNLGEQSANQERQWLTPGIWSGPALLAAALVAELIFMLIDQRQTSAATSTMIDPKQVGIALYGPYVIAVELASLLLLAGLVGAYHLGRRDETRRGEAGG